MPALNLGSPNPPAANPSTGAAVLMSPYSGPKNSPFDAVAINPTTGVKANDVNNFSTGGLSTGIGFGANHSISPTAPQSIKDAGFSDDSAPGLTMPAGTAAPDARLTAIGGGKSAIVSGTGANGNGFPASEKVSVPAPYVALPLLSFGNGGSRDAGVGPVFTGFGLKMVTATATTANGADIEAGFANRSGVSMATGQSALGSNATASPVVA
jgi:hypothetical protein